MQFIQVMDNSLWSWYIFTLFKILKGN